MITWPVILLWLLILYAALRRGPEMLYLFSATLVFGGITMLPPAVTGGTNVLPQSVCAVILVLKLLLRPGQLPLAFRLALDLRRFGLLTLFWLYGVLTAVFLPRLLAGAVRVFPLNDNMRGLQPLLPTAGNLSQAAYLTLSFGVALAFAVAGREPGFRRHYFRAVLVATILLIVSGLIDLACSAAGLSAALAPFHNASYALLTDVDLGGQKRVVGFMPEASSYGGAVCAAAAFLIFGQPVFQRRPAAVVTITTIAALVMVFLSTSSSGYVGLLAIAALFAARAGYDGFLAPRRSRRGLAWLGAGLAALAGGLALLALAAPATLAKYANIIDITLFTKTASSSYLERSSWTAAGLAAFWRSGGLGVGLGAVRTSNWYVNILASTGVFGAALGGLFLSRLFAVYLRRGGDPARPFVTAMVLALLPSAVLIGLAGTTPDPGVWIMSIIGLIAGAQWRTPPPPPHGRPAAPDS